MFTILLWSVKFTPYTDCLFPTSPLNSTVVWPRLQNYSGSDVSALFVGYSNLKTEYGDEGTKILFDTEKCGRTAFFNGDELEYSPNENDYQSKQDQKDSKDDINSKAISGDGKYTEDWAPKTRVDQNKYNHFYGDFRDLRKDFPYLIDSNFFEFIFIGDRTFIYFSTIDIITNFLSMIKKGGSLFIALNEKTLIYYYGPYLDMFLGYDYDFIPYFYTTPVTNDQYFKHLLKNDRVVLSDFRNSSVSELKNELFEKIPFLENFLEQNKTDNSVLHDGKESCILRITKL